jgi:hypothetical protein
MTIAFTRTREQLAAMVLRKLQVLANSGTADSDDLTVVYEAVDLRLKEMHRLGIFWPNVDKVPLSFTLAANTTAASATVDVLFPISLHVVNGTNDDPIKLISPREYAAISNKAESGVPIKALYNGGASFVLWPVPGAAMTASLLYEKIADDTAASTAPDVEVSMLRWLKDIIAFDLGEEFGKSETTMIRWERAAEKAERNIRKLAVPNVDYSDVEVDEYESRDSRAKSDWNTA